MYLCDKKYFKAETIYAETIFIVIEIDIIP